MLEVEKRKQDSEKDVEMALESFFEKVETQALSFLLTLSRRSAVISFPSYGEVL